MKEGKFNPQERVQIISGFVTQGIFVIAGIVWAIPTLGTYGVIYTLFMLSMGLLNAYKYLWQGRDRW